MHVANYLIYMRTMLCLGHDSNVAKWILPSMELLGNIKIDLGCITYK